MIQKRDKKRSSCELFSFFFTNLFIQFVCILCFIRYIGEDIFNFILFRNLPNLKKLNQSLHLHRRSIKFHSNFFPTFRILNIQRVVISTTTTKLLRGRKRKKRKDETHALLSRPRFKKTEAFSIFFSPFFFTLLHSFLSTRQKSSLHRVARGRRQLHRSLPIRTDHHPSPVVREQPAFFLARRTRQFGRGGCRKKMNAVIFCLSFFSIFFRSKPKQEPVTLCTIGSIFFFYRVVDDFPFTWKYLKKELIFLIRKIFKKGVSSICFNTYARSMYFMPWICTRVLHGAAGQ